MKGAKRTLQREANRLRPCLDWAKSREREGIEGLREREEASIASATS